MSKVGAKFLLLMRRWHGIVPFECNTVKELLEKVEALKTSEVEPDLDSPFPQAWVYRRV